MLNDSSQVVSLRRMDVMGAPFVVVGAFDSNGATFLPLVAEVAFDAAITCGAAWILERSWVFFCPAVWWPW